MNTKNIEEFINKTKKRNKTRLFLCVTMIIFAFPTGKFVSKAIQKASLGNPKYTKIFEPYENLKALTEREEELRMKIDTLLTVIKSTIQTLAAGTGFLIFLIMFVTGINFIQRYLSDKQYIKIIEELCDAKELRDTL
jgi:hypothetical protein